VFALALTAGFALGWAASFIREDSTHHADASSSDRGNAGMRPATSAGERQKPVSQTAGSQPRSLPTPPRDEHEYIVAMRSAFADTNGLRKQKTILELLEKLTPENALAVREIFLDFDRIGEQQPFAWWAFWTRWGEIDGPGVMEYLFRNQDQRGGLTPHKHAIQAWSATDLEGAKRWLLKQRDHPHFAESLNSLLVEYARYAGAERATAEVLTFGLGHEALPQPLAAIAGVAYRRGPGALQQWFDTLPDEHKAVGYTRVLWRLKDRELPVAIDWITAHADKPWRNDEYLGDVVRGYAAQDPVAAMNWVTSLPPSPQTGKQAGISTAVAIWADRDARGLTEWLLTKPSQPWFPEAGAALVRKLQRNDTAAAEAFLNSLQPDLKQRILEGK
nr:hypothetical protein [Verrucomicrobiota bacterium]